MTELIYQTPQRQYRIDACLPQITAARQGKIDLRAITHGKYPGRVLPDGALPEVSSLGYIDARVDQDWGMEDHRNEGIEICLQASGKNTLVTEGKKYSLSARTLTITRPWELHRVGDPFLRVGRLHWIILDVGVRRPNQQWEWPGWCVLTDEELTRLSRLIRNSSHAIQNVGDEIIDTFEELATYVTAAEPGEKTSRLVIAINRLLIALLDLLQSQGDATGDDVSPNPASQTVALFFEEIRRSPETAASEWTLASMAAHCGMGRSSFSKYSHQLHNVPPIEYLNRCRLDHAAKRLIADHASVTSIAMAMGFSSSQYFSRVFKRAFGVSPKAYRSVRNTSSSP